MASLKSAAGEVISDKAKQMDGWRSLAEPVSHLCTPYTTNAAYDGLDTYVGWRMAAFQKTCCMANWPHDTETNVVPNFLTKTSASGIGRPSNGIHQMGITGRHQRGLETRTVIQPQKEELALKETSEEKHRKRKESSSSNAHPTNVLPANAATATANHASDCTATPEDAHQSTGRVLPP